MKTGRVALLYALALLLPLVISAETLDRIAVTVGKHVISERDILQDIRISAFLDGKVPDFSADQKSLAADRLIDQYLVLEDAMATRSPLPSAEDAAPLLASYKARYANDAAFRAALAKAQISEAELNAHLLAGLRELRYTDVRFRPEVQISEESLRAYYEMMMAQASDSGAKNPAPPRTFEQSREAIEKLLTDQQTMQSLDRWLGMTRNETQILYRDQVFSDKASK